MREPGDIRPSRAEARAERAELRARRAEERAERARERLREADSPDEHERMVRHLMAHEFAAEGQRLAARRLREQAAGELGS